MPRTNRIMQNEYMRGYLKQKYEDRRESILDILGGKCACGSEKNLQVSPGAGADSSFNLSKKLNNAPWEKIASELKFYSLMCASCLAKRTKGVEHGGGASGVRNCPCGPCATKKAEYMLAKREQYNSARKAKRASLKSESKEV